ncbi:MAG: ABC transporter ATP-binding protein, partial [Limibaculum sp.]
MKGLHIIGVSHAFGDNRVLDNTSLMIPAGEVVCLLGPSGSGKTTLLRLAAGLERLQQGKILIDDVVVADEGRHVPPEHRGIGLMFQDYALFPHLSVIDNVTFGLLDQSKDKARRRAMEMLDQVGMTSRAENHPHMLSGGQQQRVALARALAPEPKVLLLDEPFSGLDTNMRGQIREETLTVLKGSGVATVMVTHDPEEAMFMADRIKILGETGRILQSGRPHDIYYHPQHEFVAKLFGLMNRFESVVEDGCVEIPIGKISAKGLGKGRKVEVLVR